MPSRSPTALIMGLPITLALLLAVALCLIHRAPAVYALPRSTAPVLTASQQPLTNITQLVSHADHTCAITNSGTVKCWGANWTGQLGDGTTIYRPLAVAVHGLAKPVTALATGAEHTCALTNKGQIQCWGGNGSGQLGNGTTSHSALPTPALDLPGNLTAIVAGANHTCAIAGGGVFCWGENSFGQLGDGTQINRTIPTPVIGLSSGVIRLAAGDEHTCALLTTGDIRCWGKNTFGQLGDGTQIDHSSPGMVKGISDTVTALGIGREHTCAILASGGLVCWGANGDGQLGDGTTLDRATPVAVVGMTTGVTAVAGGGYHTCALQSISGVVQAFCWGANWNAALGDGSLTSHRTPVAVVGLQAGVTALVAGGGHTCALIAVSATPEAGGSVQCWGMHNAGQLGDGTPLHRATPVTVSDLPAGVANVATGWNHTCARQNGSLFCWGANSYGQLAIGDYGDTDVPKPVIGLTNTVTAVEAGEHHTCALTPNGALFCWGNNWAGQLGNGSTDPSRMTAVSTMATGVTAVVAGYAHTCAIKQPGAAYCWGANWDGRLGDGTNTGRLTPIAVQGLPGAVTAVAAGEAHTCALTTTGAVLCWGQNEVGQVGDGTQMEQHSPVLVTGLSSGVSAIAVGAAHSCALLNQPVNDQRVFCWGANQFGQVGDGTTSSNRPQPVAVQGLPPSIRSLTAAEDHTCAVTDESGVFCWGANRYGQLGDNTTTDRTQAVAVRNLTSGVSQVDAGGNHTCAVTNAGSVLCWGLNDVGQLGIGGQRWRTTPVNVVEEGDTPTPPTITPTLSVTPTLPPTTPVSTPAAGDAFENDDTCATARDLTTDGAIQSHTFHQADDQDWVRFTGTAGITYTIEADVPAPSPADLVLALYSQCNGGAIQTQDYDFSPNTRLTFVAATSSVYYLRLRNQQSARYGSTVLYHLAVRALSTNNTPGALIIVAGRYQEGDPLQTQIHNVSNRVYRLWRNQGYSADRIHYLATDLSLDPDRDGRADVAGLPDQANLRAAITQWAVVKVGQNQTLTIYLIDHGGYDTLYLDEPRRERLAPQVLDQWLTQLESAAPGVKITLLIEACNGGSFIDPEQSISKPGRIVITSAGAFELAWATSSGAAFSDVLLDGLAMGKSLLGAFYEARASASLSLLAQTPWLDDDGDRIPNGPDDGALAAQSSFHTLGSLATGDNLWQPYVVWGEVRHGMNAARQGAADPSAEIWAEVRDDRGVQSVLAVIYPPSYQAPTSGEELVAGPPPITLQARGSDRYAGTYGDFSEIGEYHIFLYALDIDGLHSSPKAIHFSNGSRLFLPLINR